MEKPLSHFRKYGNGTLQIRKRTDKSGKRNGSEREFFRPFSTLNPDGVAFYNALIDALLQRGISSTHICNKHYFEDMEF
jgi:beta-glucosidase/6-phospho-beta-glucosidase/beta-galactosidase